MEASYQSRMLIRVFLLIVVYSVAVCAHVPIKKWGVVGDGPGGIIVVAVLLQVGIAPEDILWVGPAFSVGCLGEKYAMVPANNKAKRLVEFLDMCEVLRSMDTPSIRLLRSLNPDLEYSLKYIIDPLQDITNYFLERVISVRGSLTALDCKDDIWNLKVGGNWYQAERVVLAIGSHPRNLGYTATGQSEIALEVVLNKQALAQAIAPTDTVAVIGGAHSAVLAMKFLYELGVARIFNFYHHPLYYLSAEQQALRDCHAFHGDPLSGMAAAWAREVLEPNPPGNIVRIKNSECALKAWLPLCNKIVYAAGFERNDMPKITGVPAGEFDGTTGIIGPHLFGIGIAFPELIDNGQGQCSHAIGLRDFMRFAQRVVPQWMHKEVSCELLAAYDDIILFTQF